MLKNVGTNWLLNGLQIAGLMWLTPFVIRTLGDEHNGVWVTIVSLTGFLSLLVLGVPMASVRFVAEGVAKDDVDATNRAISTCLGICVGLGAGALLLGAGLFALFQLVYLGGAEWSSLSPAAVADARIAFGVVVLQVAAGFALRLPYAIFDAHQDFVLRNAIMGGELALRLGLTTALLSWRASLWVLALVQVACMLFEFTLCRIVIARRYPRLSFSLASFDRALLRRVLSFSLFALLLNVGSMLAFRTDAMVIGASLDSTQVTLYDVGNKFFDPLTTLILGIAVVVMPTATALQARGESAALEEVFLKWSKVALSLTLLVGSYLLVLGPEFLGWWIGPAYEGPSGRVLQVLMLSFLAFLPVRGVALPILLGLGRPSLPALALLVMGVVNVAISIALVGPLGILGVALGTALPNVAFAGFVLWLCCKQLGVGLGRWLAYVAGRATLGALPVLALGLWLKGRGVHGFVPLVLAGSGMVALFAVVWIGFVYRDDAYFDLRGTLGRLRPPAWRVRA